ncbi:MAG TPA: DNA-binding protein [Candidatus Acetothermia bacterium]|nr:DNA-binding protein [Candidatus Acetothermia bacterium]
MMSVRRNDEWVIRLQDGESVIDALQGLAPPSSLILVGVGMLRETALAYWNGKEYLPHTYDDPMELLSLQGNVGVDEDGSIIVHAHASIAGADGRVFGGHLLKATAHNTVELALRSLEGVLLRRRAEPSGLMGLHPSEL